MSYRRFVDNPVKVTMLFAALVLLGTLSYKRLALNLFPEIRTPRISVVVTTLGLTPEEAERRLTEDLERQLLSIKGVAGVTSYTRERNIVLQVDFHWGEDMEFAFLDVKKSVGTTETQENVEKVEVFRFDPNAAPLMTLAFTGDVDRIQMTSLIDNSLKPRLETIEGVAYVNANGTSYQEVAIFVNEDVMTQFNLTPDRIIEEIKGANINQTGGVITEGNQEMTLKFVSRFEDVEEIGAAVVSIIEDLPIHVRDIGEVELTRTLDDVRVHQDGRESISLDIFKSPEANAVLTARRVREVVEGMNQRGDYGLKVAVDQSLEVEAAIQEVIRTALIGMGLATIVLLVFLRSLFATVIVAMAIPISIVATFSLMYFQGLSLNIMTLGGLALGAGMLVDNAIVVMENIFRHRQRGIESREAAVRGVREVAAAITAATMTTIVVFVPLVYVHGIAGILFKDQAMTVVYSLVISLVVAMIMIPMLTARLRRGRERPPGAVSRIYGRFLSGTLAARWLLAAGFVAIMAVTWFQLRALPSEFFPASVGGRLSMLIEMEPGTPLDRTEAVVVNLERMLLNPAIRYHGDPEMAPLLRTLESWRVHGDDERFLGEARRALELLARTHPNPDRIAMLAGLANFESDDPEEVAERVRRIDALLDPLIVVQSVTSTIGVDPESIQSVDQTIHGPNTARMEIVLNPALVREFDSTDAIDYLRSGAAKYDSVKVTFEDRNEFLQQLLGRNRGDLAIEIHGEELDGLREAAGDVAARLRALPGFINVRTNLVLGDDEYILEPDLDALVRGEFKVNELAAQVRAYLQGSTSDKVKLRQGEMAISVNNLRAGREGIEGLLNLQIVSSVGALEKLRDLTRVRTESGLLEIMRINQERTLLVMVDLEGVDYGGAVAAVRGALDAMPWSGGETWNMSGEEVKRRESFERLQFALLIAVVLVYMVIASILESLIHPLTIMLSVPFALTGVVAGFALTGISLNLMGYIGIVMLVGIVVNNAIVLLDRIHQLRDGGLELREAVVLASRQRMRPIVMTSLTTVLALTPLAIGFGNGAELRRPMAVAVIGGLTSSTLLTLWILPGIYLCVEDLMRPVRALGRALRREAPAETSEPAP